MRGWDGTRIGKTRSLHGEVDPIRHAQQHRGLPGRHEPRVDYAVLLRRQVLKKSGEAENTKDM